MQVTQYECGNMMSPEQDCLQFLTASTGTIASFNWDTSSTTTSITQYHLSSQQYDICIRRARSYCSVCYSPQIISTTTGTASSYGVRGIKYPLLFLGIDHTGLLCPGSRNRRY